MPIVKPTSIALASFIGFPASIDSRWASSSLFFSINWDNLYSNALRSDAELRDQGPLSKARLEDSTALFTSDDDAHWMSAITSSVAGFIDWKVLLEEECTH